MKSVSNAKEVLIEEQGMSAVEIIENFCLAGEILVTGNWGKNSFPFELWPVLEGQTPPPPKTPKPRLHFSLPL